MGHLWDFLRNYTRTSGVRGSAPAGCGAEPREEKFADFELNSRTPQGCGPGLGTELAKTYVGVATALISIFECVFHGAKKNAQLLTLLRVLRCCGACIFLSRTLPLGQRTYTI